jgi:ornithine--oxo-acid transaminase
MNTLPNPWISRDHQVQAPNYHPLPVVIHRGEGIWLYDTEGKAYMDFLSGYSALCHGHSHPELIDTATQQLKALTLCSRAFYS